MTGPQYHSLQPWLVTVVTLTGTIASIFFPGPILRIFDADPELMQYGTEALRMIGPSF